MRRTKSGLPKHCTWAVDRHGKRRVRFFAPGGKGSTYLKGIPWSPDFMKQYAAALSGAASAGEIGSGRTLPGTFNALCVSYYRSADFCDLKPATQKARRNIIENFRCLHGDKPRKGLKRAHIKDIIGAKAHTPEAANSLLKVLRVMLSYAVDMEMIDSNPAIGVRRYKVRGDGFHTWSEGEVAQFEERHPINTRARLALELLLATCQRRSDVVELGWQHVRGDCIALRQKKTDTPLLIPIQSNLVAALKSVPRTNMTFLVTERGAPFSVAGFGNWFRDRCDEAGLPQCSAHGLRKLAATRLANAGCSTEQIRAMTGHKSPSEVARYTKAADQARLARQAVEMQSKARAEQNEILQPRPRLDKSGS
jgi:integrase